MRSARRSAREWREEDRKAREALQHTVEGIGVKVDAISQKVGA